MIKWQAAVGRPVPDNCPQRRVEAPNANTGALSPREPLAEIRARLQGRVCVAKKKVLISRRKPNGFLSGAADAHWQRSKPNKVTAYLLGLSDWLKCLNGAVGSRKNTFLLFLEMKVVVYFCPFIPSDNDVTLGIRLGIL